MKDTGIHEWIWMLSLLLGAVVISFLLPLVAPVFGVVLIVGGIVAYRRSTSAAMSAFGAAAIASGVFIVLISILLGLSLIAVDTIPNITEGVLTIIPEP